MWSDQLPGTSAPVLGPLAAVVADTVAIEAVPQHAQAPGLRRCGPQFRRFRAGLARPRKMAAPLPDNVTYQVFAAFASRTPHPHRRRVGARQVENIPNAICQQLRTFHLQ